jgi:hypothetical protein
LSWPLLALYTWPVHSLVTMCPVTVVVSQQRQPRFLSCRPAWRDLGRMPWLAVLLGGDLVGRSASQVCSAGTWLFIPPRELAQLDLVVRPALHACSTNGLERGFMGLAMGTPFLGTRRVVCRLHLSIVIKVRVLSCRD